MNADVQAPNIRKNFYASCLNCHEAILSPICPGCISKGFSNWIRKYPKEAKKTLSKAEKFIEKCKIFHGLSQQCITCGNKNAYLCPYCFTEYLYDLLKEAKAGKEVLGEFLFMFNFDFNHNGYYTEGEKLGIF